MLLDFSKIQKHTKKHMVICAYSLTKKMQIVAICAYSLMFIVGLPSNAVLLYFLYTAKVVVLKMMVISYDYNNSDDDHDNDASCQD